MTTAPGSGPGAPTNAVGETAGRRCAVLGSPIAHSLSPALHRAAYADLGLDWRYDAFEVDEAGLPAFVEGLDPVSARTLAHDAPQARGAPVV